MVGELYKDKDWLKEQYVTNDNSVSNIGSKVDCTTRTVRSRLKKYGLYRLRDSNQQCPDCGEWYEELSRHWTETDCCRPPFTKKQREILIGSLLGDGNYDISRNRFMWQRMITKPYLEWLQRQFGVLSNTISKCEPPSKAAQHLRDTLGVNADADNCSWGFTLQTKPHPELEFCEDWGYTEDGFESHFPDDISLTPMILKIWYIGDGNLHFNKGEFRQVEIKVVEQGHRIKYLMSLFNDVGFDVGVSSNTIRIPHGQTEQFFDYIGEPPTASQAGFAYKWQYQDHDEYKRLYETMKEQPYLT